VVSRLNRQQSQARTRELIIEAATTLFLRDGFRSTSLEQIGEHAGFTRGAVYSNFASKTAMGIAVIDALYETEEQRAIAAIGAVAEQDATAWFTALAEWAQASFGDPQWARLEIEVAAFSGTDDGLRDATAARYARIRARVAEQIAKAFRDFGIGSPSDLDELSLAFVSLALGLGVQRAVDPSIPGAAFGAILQRALAPAPHATET
jgi:AcrR family transcriptional regulator